MNDDDFYRSRLLQQQGAVLQQAQAGIYQSRPAEPTYEGVQLLKRRADEIRSRLSEAEKLRKELEIIERMLLAAEQKP